MRDPTGLFLPRSLRALRTRRVLTGFLLCAALCGAVSISAAINSPREIDVTLPPYSAKGDGKTDDSFAIQSAINSLRASDGFTTRGVIYFPAGEYLVNQSIVIRNASNVTLRGTAPGNAFIRPGGQGVMGQPVFLLVNSRFCTIQDLEIWGNTAYPPSAAIESRSDLGGATDPRLFLTRNTFRNLNLGRQNFETIGVPGMGYGIRFTATTNSDVNNDQSTIDNVNIAQFSQAGISIEHSNSLLHQIIGGRIAYGPVAVRLKGGSFQINSTSIFVGKTEFEFLDPVGTLWGTNSAGYYHASLIHNVTAESSSAGKPALLTTTSWPGTATRSSEALGISVFISNYSKKGGPQDGRPVIVYQSSGTLSIMNSMLHFAPNSQISITDARADVSFVANRVFGLDRIRWSGTLKSFSNFYYYHWARQPNERATFMQGGDNYELTYQVN